MMTLMPLRAPALALMLTLGATVAPAIAAQQETSPDGRAMTISGIVYDSLNTRPLAGALVQLAPSDLRGHVSSDRTDSLGNFIIPDVKPGDYIIGFTHPFLDSLGLEVPPRKLHVDGTTRPTISLVTPAPNSVRAQLCAATGPSDSTGLMLGFLRDADSGVHLDSGRVVLEWTEVHVSQDGKSIVPESKSVSAQATRAGWYALCGVPTAGSLGARAEVGSRASGYIDVKVPPRGVLHRDFSIPSGTTAVAVIPADTGGEARKRDVAPLRRGRARLTGVVRDRSGRALHGARILVWGSDATASTDDHGTFSLVGLPAGTQTLEARYIGYAPRRVAVDLVSGETRMVSVSLDKIADVLSEVTVYGEQSMLSRRLEGFRQRMRAGWGRFITRADIQKQAPIRLTDLLRGIPGISVRPRGTFGYVIASHNPTCGGVPVYVDGHRLIGMGRGRSGDINDNDFISVNDLVWLDWIVGIEVYSDGMSAPAEYGGWGPCPRVLIWTSMDADILDRAHDSDGAR